MCTPNRRSAFVKRDPAAAKEKTNPIEKMPDCDNPVEKKKI